MFWTPSRIESDAETYSTYLDALIEHSPIAIIVLDAQHRFEMCNPAFEDLFQYGREALSSTNVDELISAPGFSNDAPRITRRVLQGHKVHAITHRRRKDGEIIEVEVYGVPLIVNQTIRGVYGLYQDITARSRAESAVRQLSSRLMHLQEEERRRIARDLHDTTSQELAVLNINLQRLERILNNEEPRVRSLLTETLQLATECSQKIRTASYLLHPPLLQEAGLKTAVQWLVKGFADRSGIRVDVKVTPRLGHLCHEMELVLFRVIQESLANVLRHSGSQDVMVDLRRISGRLQLTVVDHGKGIRDLPLGRIRPPSVGIAGMRERVEQLGGTLHVTFSNQGTTVSAIFTRKFCAEGGTCENCA
jgi:PAS domain S-box-containing protein